MPIKDSYTIGQFELLVLSNDGKEIKKIEFYGREPKIGSSFSVN